MTTHLRQAIDALKVGDWNRAHEIVQRHEDDPLACWMHALLHKIEGDAANSRYWYSQTPHSYDEFTETEQELTAIERALKGAG